ncbi:hypothetical protein KPL39_02835 [Clostridium gasigenes]|uniref:hypothetical protein n=1 Tax=Clostridium gasigenes TaxID=94869 RepID=UPI0014383D51|nr:hypothetical protein [Clostridium gasigenes]MBU3131725.1 hypothetical protein [Clostridium gasigenes]MBU3135197.1 hypothetical protein [Clostridium gasigenes]NKF05486.1 hypothetical protein [Clostridium gasigenes]QSW18932.1 hypothetical protein J1C67_15500 [Clostridium gasigenes]
MKNILNIMKYSFKSLKILYFIEFLILLVGLVSGKFLSQFTGGWDVLAIVSTIATMNFISYIILFSKQISKDYGYLLFLTPIKGIEFIVGHLLGLVSANLIVIIIALIVNLINIGEINSGILQASVTVIMGLITAYLIITALIGIFSSYIRNKFLSIIAIIIIFSIGSLIYDFITSIILSIMPYVYITIGNSNIIEIDVISSILGILTVLALQIIAGKYIDKKIDIL